MPRLAACFYWTILNTSPDDVPRYRRVFGDSPDDPQLNRLQALGYEKSGDYTTAHKYWQLYEKEIAAHAADWPAGDADAARAIVWEHMGENAPANPQ